MWYSEKELRKLIREACAIGWDAAVGACEFDDGSELVIIENKNPYRD